jgi:peptidoglycan LD-endopeptidase LytH
VADAVTGLRVRQEGGDEDPDRLAGPPLPRGGRDPRTGGHAGILVPRTRRIRAGVRRGVREGRTPAVRGSIRASGACRRLLLPAVLVRRIPPQRILLLVVLTQAAVALGLLVYLAAAKRMLVVELTTREAIRTPAPSDRLVIPVAGVRPDEVIDTFGAPRSGGRTHEGIDIFAPAGTPVLAAAAGVIVARDSSALGGLAVYHRDHDQRTVYFYGHLQRYRADLKEGDVVRQGEPIAHVGETGNVPPGSPHLHFSVYTVTDPNRWWRGRNLRPCDLLPCRGGGESVPGGA